MQLKHVTLLVSRFFFFLAALIILLPVAGVSFGFLVHSCRHLNFFYLSSFLAGSAGSSYGGTDFGSLVLGSSEREKSSALVPWVCTFKAVLLERRSPWRQRISKSRTMMVDLEPALASTLTFFCTISSKFTDSRSCYSILTIIKGLRPSWK